MGSVWDDGGSVRPGATNELRDFLDALAREAIQLVHAEGGCAGLRTEAGMVCHRYFQNGRALDLEYCWPPMHGLPGWLLVHKVPYLTNDAARDSQIVPELCSRFRVRTALSTPILDDAGEPVGFFEIHNRRDGRGFSSLDRDQLVGLARMASLAIGNIRSLQAARHAGDQQRVAHRELSAEVRAMTRLHDLAMRISGPPRDLGAALLDILQTAVDLHGARMGLLSRFDPAPGLLVPAAATGFSNDVREILTGALSDGKGACGVAFAGRERVIIADTETDPRFENCREAARLAGFRAVHSTPILTRSGEILGVLSVHFEQPRTPTRTEMQLSDLCARHAAEAIEAVTWQNALRQSEEKFRQIVETASEGIWIVDPAGVTTFVNGRMCEMIGYDPAELIGRCCFDLIHPDDRPRGSAAFQRRKQGDTGAREYRVFRKNGEMIWIHFSGAPLRDPAGNLAGVLGMCTDITERKFNEARYQALFATSLDGVLIVNDEGIYVDVNPAYCAMLKSTREQLIGTAFAPHIPADRLPDAEEAFHCLVTTGRYEGEFPLLASDGSVVELEWRSVSNFVPGLHCCVARDVRERNRFEQQIQRTQKLESLGIMAGGIAHDFNNLLVGILGNASLAHEISLDTAVKPMLQDVVTASERAAGLVRQMLTYAGQGRGAAAPTNIAALVRETVGLLKASIPKQVALELNLDDALPWVESDPAQLQQVIMNMVINAAEAIPEGCPGAVTVAASARRLEAEDQARSIIPIGPTLSECVEIRFTDTGCGMPPEVQQKIFDPFFTTKFAGRGLGLSAVLGIVRSHGGTLILESSPGHGTTFRVLLPATQAAAEPGRDGPSLAVAIAGSVLVVDDEETVRAAVQRALEHHGYSVHTAETGPEAVEILAAHPEISAVVLDLAMPVMTGDQVVPLLRAKNPNLPIILSSGYSELEARRKIAGGGGIVAFLQKPYTAATLAEKLRAVLSDGRTRTAAS